jgi:ATP-dependent Clp protease adaptor protein ClpS
LVKEKIKPVEKKEENTSEEKELILFNDDINTFEYVIETLIDVCGHDPFQAEQCALTAHYNGKCGVKSGSFEVLKPYYDEMVIRELTVTISG